MSQPPPNRFGFQNPKNVTVTSTTTSRIPGSSATRTVTNTTVTNCSDMRPPQTQVSRIAAPTSFRQQQGSGSIAAPTGLHRPATGGMPSQATGTQAAPTSSRASSGSRLPQSFRQQQQGSGIPGQASRSVAGQTSSLPVSVSRLPSQIKPPATRAAPSGIPRTSSLIPGSGALPPAPNVSAILSLQQGQQPSPRPTAKIPQYSMRQQQQQDLNVSRLQTLQRVPKSLQTTEQKIHQTLLNQSVTKPGEKVCAKAKTVSKLRPLSFKTPAGNEKVLQKAVLEKRVERGVEGERIVETVAISDLNEATGQMERVEIGVQQLNPDFDMTEGKEAVGVTSTVVVTPAYSTVSKEVVRTITKPLDGGALMDLGDVARLVEEEQEDVNNTLKMVQPDMVVYPGNYEKKQRLQQLRINAESIALLEESIVQPKVCADETLAELMPEAMATVMHSVEKGATPDANPEQLFNSLFVDPTDDQIVELSSVSPGPLRDVVVPTDQVPRAIHQAVVTEDMVKLTNKYEDVSENVPYVDIFTRVMEEMKKSPGKGRNKPKSYRPIADEKSLWVNANLEHLVNIVGAEPMDILDAADVDKLNKTGDLEKEMAEGVDYFLETNALQYTNRVQLRGSQFPSYFPGYVVVSPDLPGIVQIAKSPDEVFATAWRSVQPKYFADDSLLSQSSFL